MLCVGEKCHSPVKALDKGPFFGRWSFFLKAGKTVALRIIIHTVCVFQGVRNLYTMLPI